MTGKIIVEKFIVTTATAEDSLQISSLLIPLVKKFITNEFSAQAEKIMLDSMQPEVIEKNFENNYEYFIALDTQAENQMVGVLGMKTPTHLFHLFVKETHHGQGIAKLLRQHLLELSNEQKFTVNASRYAQSIYTKLGFSGEGKLLEKNGITCFPMVYCRSN